MKKNGFTLIELLAVIVILAIIALIATPIILNIINDAKEESNERSVELYASAIKNGIAAYQLREGKEVLPGTYNETNKLPFEVEYDGQVDCTSVTITEDGKVTLEGCKVNGGEKEYSYGIEEQEEQSELAKLCTPNTTKAKALVWQGSANPALETSYAEQEVGLLASIDGAYTPGVAYTCNFIDDSETNNMTFFVLSSTESDVTLISGANLEGTVAWCGDETKCKTDGSWDNTKGPITANEALTDKTSNWSIKNGGKLNDTQMGTIKLPTAYQIAEAVGQTFTGSNISGLPTWLNSYTKTPVANGYWTSTPHASISGNAWAVQYSGSAFNASVSYGSGYGARPVINLSI